MSAAVAPVASEKKQTAPPVRAPATSGMPPPSFAGTAPGIPLFLQTKLRVNEADDEYEREAEDVADVATGTVASGTDIRPSPALAVTGDAGDVTRVVDSDSESTTLPAHVRERIEPLLDADLGDVRVHTGPSAARSADALNARAFAHDRHIWLGERESAHDVRLMAHEATHVVQQTGGGRTPPAGATTASSLPLFLQRRTAPRESTTDRARHTEFRPPSARVPAVPVPARFATASVSRVERLPERRPESSSEHPAPSAGQGADHDAAHGADTAAPGRDGADGTHPEGTDARAHTAAGERDPSGHARGAGPAGERAGAGGGRRAARGGGGAGGQLAEEAEESTEESAIPPQVDRATDEPLVAPSLDLPPLVAEWAAPASLSADSLPKADPAAAPSKPAQSSSGENKEKEKEKDKEKEKASTPPQRDPEERLRQVRDASDVAQRAYQDLSQRARTEQSAFIAHATDVMQEMTHEYENRAGEIIAGLDSDHAAVDAAADRARTSLEEAAATAGVQLEVASTQAGVAIEAAGRSAYGLINAGMTHSAQAIETVVSSLVSGHLGAFNSAIAATRAIADVAVIVLNAWRDARETNYPTEGGTALEGAKNESRQARIPRLVEPEVTRINERVTQKTTAWASSRDTTVCGLGCSYRSALEAENQRMATQGRTSVTSALGRARTGLKRQTNDGKKALASLVASFQRQIDTQQRATKSRLSSQARASLFALRGEAQSALMGVQGAAKSALPSYWRAAQGLEQTIGGVASKGPQAVEQTAKKAPDGILDGLRRARVSLDDRLDGNRTRLEHNVAEKAHEHEQSRGEALAQLDTTLQEQSSQATQRFDESIGGFVTAFRGLSTSVSQAAESWAQPLQTRMASFIDGKRAEAQAALTTLLTGVTPPAPASAAPPPAADGGAGAASCGSCETAAASGGGAGGAAAAAAPAPAAGGAAAGPQGLTAQVDAEIAYFTERLDPATLYTRQLTDTGEQVNTQLTNRAAQVAQKFEGGFGGTVDEEGVIAALRGLTAVKGRALDTEVYPGLGSGTLDYHLRHYLGADSTDYAAASAYLRGDAVEGARLELADSTGFFNDDEARIEATMRALSPDQLAALGAQHPGVMAEVRDALGGTDQQVFDALAQGDYARADAYRMRDAIDEARGKDDADAVHRAIEQWTGAPAEGDWRATQEMSADDRRTAVVSALGHIVSDADVSYAAGTGGVAAMSAEDRAVAYVSREVQVLVTDETGHGRVEGRSLTGANRDLATALLRHGGSSVEARAARLGVEIQRTGEAPNALNIDRATFDDRFSADLAHATPEEREAHARAAAERARVVMLAAERYAGGAAAPDAAHAPVADPEHPGAAMTDARVTDARDRLIASLSARFGSDTLGAELTAGLLTDARPTPATAARAMRLGMRGAGTNEELLFRFTERMNRDEIAAMRTEFHNQTGENLDAELGVYGEGGTFTELSGDDRLRMERAMRGVARNDRERLENAAFALQQQRNEAGSFGAWLAEGTLADRVMTNTEHNIQMLAGGPIAMNRRGEVTSHLANFDPTTGRYTGTDHDSFMATVSVAQTVAENYAKRIDAFADVLTTGIAILGAIAAAVITVVTGGAAAPLIAAAVVAGLASMAANYAIKGGRYGWEQAGIDLAMTAVQAITAGVGAQLGAAAQVASKGAAAASQATRTLAALSRIFTGNPVVDQIIVGAITGSISGLGQAALNEQVWEGKDPVRGLFDGLIRGALSGAATAALTQSLEALGRNGAAISDRARALAATGGIGNRALGTLGRGVGAVGRVIGAGMNASAEGGAFRAAGSMALRGMTRATISGLSAMAGRGTEILYNVHTGEFHGDAGDALLQMGEAGLHAALQGLGEGAGEAVGQRFHNQRLTTAADSIRRTRAEMGLEALPPHDLHAAAEDLLFLNTHGRLRGGLGEALHLEHVATHGGITPTIATLHPEPVVRNQMHEELMRHVSPEMRAELADVPIRVMPEAEYVALTRSESGRVATIIENGEPVVIIREGTSLSRLADEGPHLVQAREHATRPSVARLDEATLAHWDSLDIDTQIDLYHNKIGLEIDAHQRIARSLETELASASNRDARVRIQADIERNEGTLRNLRARAEEVSAISPERRAAIAAGHEEPPQYLDQPARLFSKEETEGRRGGLVDDETPDVPDEPPRGRRGEQLFDDTPEQAAARRERLDRGVGFNNEQEGRYSHNEVYIENPNKPGEYLRVDSYSMGNEILLRPEHVLGPEIHERYHSQLASVPEDIVIAKMNKVVDDYAGARIAEVPSTARLRAESERIFGAGGDRLHGRPVLIIPEQHAPIPHEILAHAERIGLTIRDRSGREYTTVHPEGDDTVLRASPHSELDHAEQMRDALLRHVPEEHHDALSGTEITVLPPHAFLELTGSVHGPVVTLIKNGRPYVVIREGTPIARLADEGPHLMQVRSARTRAQVASLDEATMRRWNDLDLDTQLDLYRTKIALEIEAHRTIARSLDAELARGGDPATILREIDRNEGTLRNLRARREEVDRIGPRRRAAIEAGREDPPQYLREPARLFSKDSPAGLGSREQPELRGPRVAAEPDSVEGLRQRHEDWVERMRREFLAPGTTPPMVEGEPPKPGRYPWHADIASAYAEYNALVQRYNGRREVGIYRNADTGEYMVALGSAVHVQARREALRQETVLHYHPDYGPSLYHGPSGTDLSNTAAVARETGRPVTEFIEFGVGAGRARTAFTLSPIPDASAPGGIRMQIDLEFIHPTTGEYTHQRFDSRREWSQYYNSRTAAFDPDGAVYWHIMRSLGLSDEQIRAGAARHRESGTAEPPPPEFLPPRGSRGSAIVGDDESAAARAVADDVAAAVTPRGQRLDADESPSLRESAAALRDLQREQRQLDQRLEENLARQRTLHVEQQELRSRREPGTSPTEREADIDRRLAGMHDAEARMRTRRDLIADEIRIELRTVLPQVARRLTADIGELIRAIQRFETDQGRRMDGKEIIESLRNRVRKAPFADLEGLISTASLEENILAIEAMRTQIGRIKPDAVLSVQRGGAFLAEVLGSGVDGFPPSVSVPKHVVQQPGQEDLVQRTPHLEAEIRRRIALGERTFVVVDFYMGGHFAEELETMVQRLHADFPDIGLQVHPMWMRETHGYDTIATPAPSPTQRAPRPTRAQLMEGVTFIGRETVHVVVDPVTGEQRRYLRFRRESETVTLPTIKGNADNLPVIRLAQYPVGIVLGDDMNTVFDPSSRHPIRIFDREGRIVQEIPVGTPDPITKVPLGSTREILIRLMQGVRFPRATEPATVP